MTNMTIMTTDEIETLLNVYKNISKNNRGDLVSSLGVPPSIINPFTRDEEPVYSMEEAELVEEMHIIKDEIDELEDFMKIKMYEIEKKRIQKDIDKLTEKWDTKGEELRKLRSKSGVDADKEAEIRKAENRKRMAKKKERDAKHMREERIKAEANEKRQKILDTTPENLINVINNLF